LPIHLRNFYYNQLIETKKKEQEEVKKSQKTTNTNKGPGVRVRK
jgi:hypothetical protein